MSHTGLNSLLLKAIMCDFMYQFSQILSSLTLGTVRVQSSITTKSSNMETLYLGLKMYVCVSALCVIS